MFLPVPCPSYRSQVYFFLISWAFLFTHSTATAQIPKERLEQIKKATVSIKQSRPNVPVSCSGFVYSINEKNEALVITNEQLLTAWEKLPVAHPESSKLSVQFANGPESVVSLPAQILVSDASLDMTVLSVKPREGFSWPKPLVYNPKIEISETLPVYAVGYPLEVRAPDETDQQPITFNRGSITSLRTIKKGQTRYYQLDITLNPGLGGGPVVNSNGELVAVCRIKAGITPVSYGIPASEIDRIFAGKPSPLVIEGFRNTNARFAMFSTTVLDPTKKIKELRVLYRMEGATPKYTESKEPHASITDSQFIPLSINGGQASGKLTLPNINRDRVTFTFQLAYLNEANQWTYSSPVLHEFLLDNLPPERIGKTTRPPDLPPAVVPPNINPDMIPPNINPDFRFPPRINERTPMLAPTGMGGPQPDMSLRPKEPEGVTLVDAVKPSVTLEVAAKISRFVFDSNEKFAYFVNRTDSTLCRIDLDKNTLDEKKLALEEGAHNLFSAGDGKQAYLSQIISSRGSGSSAVSKSKLHIVELADMKKTDSIDIDGQLIDLAIMPESKIYLLVQAGYQKNLWVLDIQKRNIISKYTLTSGVNIRAADQLGKLYVSSDYAPGSLEVVVPGSNREPISIYRSPYFNLKMAGGFEISPDYKHLISMSGNIFRLSKTNTEDLQYFDTIEEHNVSAWDKETKIFWTANDKLRSHSAVDYKPMQGFALPGAAYRIAIAHKNRSMLLAVNNSDFEKASGRRRASDQLKLDGATAEGIGPILIYKLDQLNNLRK